MATGVGVPVLMAANIGTILADDNLTFDQERHDAQVDKMNRRGKRPQNQNQPSQKPREYFSISYDKQGFPKVSTLVDRDPYNLDERYRELMWEQ